MTANTKLDQRPRRRNRTRRQTLRAALDRLLERTEERIADGVRSPATLRMQRQHCRYICERLGPRRPLSRINERLVERFVRAERGGRRRYRAGRRRIQARTLLKRLSTLRSALVLAKRERRIVRVPEFPQIDAPPYRARRRILETWGDYLRLFLALTVEEGEALCVGTFTGQHLSDIFVMTWGDVDLDSSVPSMCIRNSKNRRPRIRVQCPSPMVEVLRARRDRLIASGVTPKRTDPLLAPWPRMSHELPAAARALGLPAISPTDLRHTCASWMIRRRGITKAAMEFLGHSSLAMITRIYGHALPPQLADVVAELESIATEPHAGGKEAPPSP